MPISSCLAIARRTLLLFVMFAGLPACTISYNALGRYGDGAETFTGRVEAKMMGGGTFQMQSDSSGATCEGVADATEVSFTACAGQRGTMTMTCQTVAFSMVIGGRRLVHPASAMVQIRMVNRFGSSLA